MGERKVLNRYFPPDFDPAALPKRKRAQTNDMKVRMMLPMSVRCKTCGTFMYKGTKFNTRKEDVLGENYLGIQVYRFYYRCTHCGAEFTMKTDPQTNDYKLEEGATRNYEHWREEEKVKTEAVKAREEEEMGNAMKALENRTLDSKREMDIMAALDEMRALKSRHAKISTEEALAALQREADKQLAAGGLPVEDVTDDMAEFYRLRRSMANQQLRDGEDSEDGEQPGAQGDGGPSTSAAQASRRTVAAKKAIRTAGAGLSLAAAAMEEELEEEQDGSPNPAQQQDAQPATGPAGTGAQPAGDDDDSAAGTAQVPDAAVAAGEAGGPAASAATPGQAPAGGAGLQGMQQLQGLGPSRSQPGLVIKPQFKVVAKPKPAAPAPATTSQQPAEEDGDAGGGLARLLGAYSSSSDDADA